MKLKSFVFMMRQPPLLAGPEAFDLPLTAAAFDQEVQLLLLDDGVQWLRFGLPPLLQESFDVVLVERQSLTERGMETIFLPKQVRLMERAAVADLLAAAVVVVGG